MTEQQTPAARSTGRGAHDTPGPMDLGPDARTEDLSGWVRFGGVMMTVIGAFGVVEGLVALLTPNTYFSVNGTVLSIDLAAWGWVHLILGALLLVTGVSLLREAPPWARGLGTALVGVSILVQLAWMPAYPFWSVIMITLGVIVIYALVATWEDR
jgi:hypothetical protein